MSDSPPHDPQATHDAKKHDIRDHDSRRNAAKWAAGAAGAAILLGGGYYALKNMPSSQPATEVASTQTAYDASSPAPFAAGTATGNKAVTTDAAQGTAVSTDTATTKSAASRRRAQESAAAAEVPEQVIGVTPASYDGADNSDEIVVTAGRRPVWATRPTARRLSALYPARALERGREGEASVHCMVLDTGALDCLRASEAPANSGFGNAALRVASKFRHAPQRADGSAAAGTPVNLRVVFRISDNDRRRG